MTSDDAVNDAHNRCRRILFVCDFFYPRLGGVEMHQYSLAQCLIRRGHKVVVLTHAYDSRVGIRWMTDGLKVYYAPVAVMCDQCSFPTLFAFFPYFRQLCLREQIEVVHGHQATSQLMHEAMLHAGTMGLRTVYTDHSLFGFADAASIHANKVLSFTIKGCDHAICVSRTCRENLVLRASLPPTRVSAIPNAVDTTRFEPRGSKDENRAQVGQLDEMPITVVVISRLAYRKGIDLLARVIPIACAASKRIRFLVGGDGPKRLLLVSPPSVSSKSHISTGFSTYHVMHLLVVACVVQSARSS
jgi:phosphatidylinositol glycan class A protein